MADIELSSINKFFGKTHVIKDFSLNIKSQSFTTLVGPSGWKVDIITDDSWVRRN